MERNRQGEIMWGITSGALTAAKQHGLPTKAMAVVFFDDEGKLSIVSGTTSGQPEIEMQKRMVEKMVEDLPRWATTMLATNFGTAGAALPPGEKLSVLKEEPGELQPKHEVLASTAAGTMEYLHNNGVPLKAMALAALEPDGNLIVLSGGISAEGHAELVEKLPAKAAEWAKAATKITVPGTVH